MAKVTLNDITAGYGSNDLHNANNAAIEAGFENTLSRDGTTPNQMNADIDMNSNDILNVATANVGTLKINGAVVSALETGVRNFETRADAIAGSTGSDQYIFVAGLPYVYDASGTDLTTGDSRTWTLIDTLWFDDVTSLIADTETWYSEGLYLMTRNERFAYKVAASAASDHHRTTAGGVKLYAIQAYEEDQFATLADGLTAAETDDIGAVSAALTRVKYQRNRNAQGPAFQVIRADSPTDYDTSQAVAVFQHEFDNDGADVPNGTKKDNDLFIVTDTAQGITASSSSSGVITGRGRRVFYHKENDGSGQAFTASGELDANGVDNSVVGANGYNELGAFQATLTNIGSSNGYMSGGEVHLRDSPDDGVNDYATRMTGFASGIKKYNASALPTYNFHALNEGGAGSLDLDTILRAETAGNGAWKRGIDLYDDGTWNFSTGVAIQMKETNKIRWTDGTNHSEVYANANSHIILAPGTAAAQVYNDNNGSLSAPAWSFSADPDTGIFRNGTNDLQFVAGGVAGIRILNNNIQVSIAGGALKTVTEGAADSGGVGFKLLRVPN